MIKLIYELGYRYWRMSWEGGPRSELVELGEHWQAGAVPGAGPRLRQWGERRLPRSDAPATVRPQLAAASRRSTFGEVVGGLDESNALFEARRCLSCGNCFACDNCYGVCPDNAVVKLEPGVAYGYAIDLDYCKGCGMCVAECPCGALEIIPETI